MARNCAWLNQEEVSLIKRWINNELGTSVRPIIQRVHFVILIKKKKRKVNAEEKHLYGRKTLSCLFIYFIFSVSFSQLFPLASYHTAEREEGACCFSEQAEVLLLAWETAGSVLK